MVHLRQVYIVSRCCESRHLHFCIQTECHYQETQESSCTLESAFRMPLKKMTIKWISTPTKRLLKALSALTIRDRKLYVQIAKAARITHIPSWKALCTLFNSRFKACIRLNTSHFKFLLAGFCSGFFPN